MSNLPKTILLDIEGTTSSISFVYDVMFPYVRENLESFLNENWSREDVQACLPLLKDDLAANDDWPADQADVVSGVIKLMDDDVKATGLKQLQGLIWHDGFTSGTLVAHLFDDVADAIRSWHAEGVDIRIYSSGSIAAQRLFFGHTVAGDLLPLVSAHYDTTTGNKKNRYRRHFCVH